MMETENQKRKIYSLYDITKSIKSIISKTYTGYYRVKAEIVKLNYYPKSGHCYPDLVEKQNGVIKAQMRANIWSSVFTQINNKFISVTGEPLKDGMHVLFLARVIFHEHYGLSLNILDMEPSFTLGEMAKEKAETIKKLQNEGIFLRNKSLPFPLLPKRIAIISVDTSKGYHDFINVIQNNNYNYVIEHTLFPALLQGDDAVRSISLQLDEIEYRSSDFDVVCIIRGGGGDVGLNAYDNYLLAKKIALFPLPVITGIGHSTNETVSEMVAYANKITPTEAAHFILEQFIIFEGRIIEAEEKLVQKTAQLIMFQNQKLDGLINSVTGITSSYLSEKQFNLEIIKKSLVSVTRQKISSASVKLTNLSNLLQIHSTLFIKQNGSYLMSVSGQLSKTSLNRLSKEEIQLSNKEKLLHALMPENILKRGYSITYIDGKPVKDATKVAPGTVLTTQLFKGKIKSKTIEIK